jgi:hypothetical protein
LWGTERLKIAYLLYHKNPKGEIVSNQQNSLGKVWEKPFNYQNLRECAGKGGLGMGGSVFLAAR